MVKRAVGSEDHRSGQGGSREQICQAVWQVMYTRGVGAVSVRSVARAAGMSPGRVQHHFPAKLELLHASLEYLLEAAAAVHAAVTVPTDPAGELWHLLVHALPRTERSRVGVAVYYSYVALAVTDPVIAGQLGAARAGLHRELTRLIVQLVPELAQPGELARRLQATAEGLTLGVFLADLTWQQAQDDLQSQLRSVGLPVPDSAE